MHDGAHRARACSRSEPAPCSPSRGHATDATETRGRLTRDVARRARGAPGVESLHVASATAWRARPCGRARPVRRGRRAMTGMNRGVGSGNPLVVAAFHTALAPPAPHHLRRRRRCSSLAWNVARAIQFRAGRVADVDAPDAVARRRAERRALGARAPRARRAADRCSARSGRSTASSSCSRRCRSGCRPACSRRPRAARRRGSQHVVNVGVTIWSNHPITAAASAVWIQLGIGIALLVAPRGRVVARRRARVAPGGGSSCGSSARRFGGDLHAGGELAVRPARAPRSSTWSPACSSRCPRRRGGPAALGRWLLRRLGAFFVGMGVLQAWPGRGTWAGQADAARGTRAR